MIRSRAVRWFIFFLLVILSSPLVFAETIELVTYYPANVTTGETCVESLKVGTAYCPQDLQDGQAIIFDWLGIGPGLTAGNRPAAAPDEPLWVMGNILALGPVAKGALFIADRNDTDQWAGLRLATDGLVQWTIGLSSNQTEDLHFGQGGGNPTRLLIQQETGNVGIGTTVPTGLLHVRGKNDATSNVLFMPGADTAAADTPDIRVGIGTAAPSSRVHVQGAGTTNGTSGFRVTDSSGNSNLSVLDNGNVRMGAPGANPAIRLEVAQNSAIKVGDAYISSGSPGGGQPPYAFFGVNAWYDGSGSWTIPDLSSRSAGIGFTVNGISFSQTSAAGSTAWKTRWQIDENGRIQLLGGVFIGDTANDPSCRVTVQGTSGQEKTFFRIQDAAGHRQTMGLFGNSSELRFINEIGTFGKLDTAGNWVNGSDRAFKKEIENIRYGLAEILRLKPRRYRMKAGNDAQIGFIGQEVREVIPEVVSGEEGQVGLSYGQMSAVIVKAIQEQQQEIKELRAENGDLRKNNHEMQTRLQALEENDGSLSAVP